jgi:quercetin dioxygenase-like cupin family protein
MLSAGSRKPSPVVSSTLKITPTESLTIRESTPELLEVEATYGPGGEPPPKHFHPSQDEHFEVLAGAMRARVSEEERSLSAGDTLDIPRRTPHQMWNPRDEPARVLWQTSPAGRTEEWFRSIDALHREGRVQSNGIPGPLAFGVLLTEYRDVFRLATGVPDPIARVGLSVLGVIGRARGYSPVGG